MRLCSGCRRRRHPPALPARNPPTGPGCRAVLDRIALIPGALILGALIPTALIPTGLIPGASVLLRPGTG
ncbi:MAG: hypothetical protein M3021_05750, partial [Actinomycetota bacterium]|nr:hypothetical protein [Actinomycetota bacterium]